MVVFEEIPDEVTLAINITNCPCRCKGCHSKFLWEDIGTDLTLEELERLIQENDGITCVCFMGGDANPKEVSDLAKKLSEETECGNIKIAWYSGRDEISEEVDLWYFDYVKIGHYDEEYGGLNKETTNQRLYRIIYGSRKKDITQKFWKKM